MKTSMMTQVTVNVSQPNRETHLTLYSSYYGHLNYLISFLDFRLVFALLRHTSSEQMRCDEVTSFHQYFLLLLFNWLLTAVTVDLGSEHLTQLLYERDTSTDSSLSLTHTYTSEATKRLVVAAHTRVQWLTDAEVRSYTRIETAVAHALCFLRQSLFSPASSLCALCCARMWKERKLKQLLSLFLADCSFIMALYSADLVTVSATSLNKSFPLLSL